MNPSNVFEIVVGSNAPASPLGLGQIAARSVVVYLMGLFAIRIGKSRLLSRASAMDVLLGFMLGAILSRAISGASSLSSAFVATVTLVGLHWLLSKLTSLSHRWGLLIKGHEYPLVSNGQILWDNLRRSHLSEADLREQLRLNANIDDPKLVMSAYKERSGEIGVVKQPAKPHIVEIRVEDGVQLVRISLTPGSSDEPMSRKHS
ncbi:MAG: hypothetical protein JWN70_4994 [Planctomycetaceae bacterium]|nr:hypothetical protein [Planctomycetaceae bacterium]